MTTYCIGGIATDHTLFDPLLLQLPGAVYLPFPQHSPDDTMEHYALRFLPLIDTTAPFHIIANSMGGIITMELLRYIQPEKVILISSVKCRKEMPWRLRQLKYTRLHRLLSGRSFQAAIRYGSRFVAELNRTPGLRDTVIRMAEHNKPQFLSWCVNAIVNWQGKEDYREDIIHIHGTRDAMFPFKLLSGAIPVAGGTHNMQLCRSAEIVALLRQYLERS